MAERNLLAGSSKPKPSSHTSFHNEDVVMPRKKEYSSLAALSARGGFHIANGEI
jgi:hypothetical protein